MSERAEVLAAVLAEHGPSGSINSREGWVECLCDARLPVALDRDGYEVIDGAEDAARHAHVAAALDAALEQQGSPAAVSNGQRRG